MLLHESNSAKHLRTCVRKPLHVRTWGRKHHHRCKKVFTHTHASAQTNQNKDTNTPTDTIDKNTQGQPQSTSKVDGHGPLLSGCRGSTFFSGEKLETGHLEHITKLWSEVSHKVQLNRILKEIALGV